MSKGKILYAAWCAGRSSSGYHRNTARHFGFCRYWILRDYEIDWQHKALSRKDWELLFNSNNYKHALIFNGNHSSMDVVRNLAHDRNIDTTIFEGGFFRNRSFVLDSLGYGPNSSLCDDSFSWLNKSLQTDYFRFKEEYTKGLKPKASDYIIAPLQVEFDPTLKKFSNCGGSKISSMREWIEYVDTKFNDHVILYRSHPLHDLPDSDFRELQKCTKNIVTEPIHDPDYKSFMRACSGAYMCLGIHTHAMAQSMILDIPTYAHAMCPMWRIRDGGKDKKKLDLFLAACYHNTVSYFDLRKTEDWYKRNYPDTV